ncbi:hypothetical protein GDO86_014748 [Hymenochirus boettgeri]|uniref:Haloacid dehalogenase-like hydrolase domain-containing protein 3 n=1 Tax=Hymenochirus boettgeri TaxID=247094 RepID=A0A8T2JY92_9PIPI|nr:hypothetical protein GDO86_014748 [Hymenochirus boettgeri]
MAVRLVTWDVKDTLLRLRLSVGQQYYAEAKKRGIRVDPDILERSFHDTYRSHCRLFPNYGMAQGMTSRQWWIDVVLQTFHQSGVHNASTVQPLAEQLYADFCTARNWAVIPGARETLKSCRNLGLRMGIISNFDRRLVEVLRQCHLDQYFEFVMTSESAGVAKPHPGIFCKALRLAKIDARQVVHVGDDYVNDYQAARMVGMDSYLLGVKNYSQDHGQDVPDGHVIESPQQLIPKLENALK